MKPTKLLFNALILIALMGLMSCGGGSGSSSPGDVTKTAIENLANENYDDVIKVYVTKKGEDLSDEEQTKIMAFMPTAKAEIDKNGGLKEVQIIEETIAEDGNTASVKSKMIYGNGKEGKTDTTKLIKVNGSWRIRIN